MGVQKAKSIKAPGILHSRYLNEDRKHPGFVCTTLGGGGGGGVTSTNNERGCAILTFKSRTQKSGNLLEIERQISGN